MDEKLRDHFLELIRRNSTDLPEDVEAALMRGRDAEADGSSAKGVIGNILENVKLAREKSASRKRKGVTPTNPPLRQSTEQIGDLLGLRPFDLIRQEGIDDTPLAARRRT